MIAVHTLGCSSWHGGNRHMQREDQSDSIVPTGAFYFPVDAFVETRSFKFLLLPKFTLLAFSSAVDPLRIANQLAQKQLYSWEVLSEDGQPVRSSSGVEVAAQRALSDVTPKSHVLVCSGNRGSTAASRATLDALRKHYRFGGTVGGICTGAITLARAGLLDDRAFTLHWENQPSFVEGFTDLTPTNRRFEVDGGLFTCGGGVAAAEMMIWMIARDYGPDFAIVVSDMCLHQSVADTGSEQRSSIAKVIGSRNPRIVHVVREMLDNIEEPVSLEQLAKNVNSSRRQVERLFRKVVNDTPMKFYRNLRLDRARSLLSGTDMTITEVMIACGFGVGPSFAKNYKARFGETPSVFRKSGENGGAKNEPGILQRTTSAAETAV